MTNEDRQTVTQREAFEAFEAYLNEQKWVLGMPGLKARPAFVAGYLAATAAERERCAKVCERERMVRGGEVFAAEIRKG